jgi:hypothetical protein
MSNLTKVHKAYIYAWRGNQVPLENVSGLDALLGCVSDAEMRALAEWEMSALESVDIRVWCEDGAGDGVGAEGSAGTTVPPTTVIVRSMALKTGHQCLIPMSYLNVAKSSSCADLSQRLALAYYERRGFAPTPPKIVLTDEQQKIADLGLFGPSVEMMFVVVQAGPGTGKSTTAVEMARNIVKCGGRVMMLAYTNSATTTLRRKVSADRYLGNKYTNEPFSSANAAKQNKKQILLSTIDQVARTIQAGQARTRTYGATVNFERIISDALAIVRNSKDSLNIFFENGQVPMFDYVIVDEGQMLTNDRASLIMEIVKGMCRTGINGKRSCHLVVFNDPKQAIAENAGLWLKSMYEKAAEQASAASAPASAASRSAPASAQATVTYGGNVWRMFSLHYSYRFKTAAMLEFVMKSSRTRPALHVELTIHDSVERVEVGPPAYARGIDDLPGIAFDIGKAYETSRSVGILTPSYGRTNTVSKQLNALILELQRQHIPLCLHGDDNYQANGVVITTFNSCAGMEFSYVFIIGAAGYPKNYPQVSMEVGRSLMFVANSRARLCIWYLLDRPELCADVEQQSVIPLMDTSLKNYTVPDKYTPKFPAVWTVESMFGDMYNSAGAASYMENNGIVPSKFQVASRTLPLAKTTSYAAISAYGVPSVIRDAKSTSALASASMINLEPGTAHHKGLASCGRMTLDCTNCRIGSEETGSIHSMLPPPSNAGHTQASAEFYWYSNKRPEPETDADIPNAERLKDALVLMLKEMSASAGAGATMGAGLEKEPCQCRQMTKGTANGTFSECYAIAPDLLFKLDGREGFVCITDRPLYAMYVGAVIYLSTRVMPLIVQVNPQQGSISIFDGFHERMAYQLDALRRIHIYAISTLFKDNFLGIPREKRPSTNMYTIDTEYVNGGDIYEIGILCLGDPYASFCTAIKHEGRGKVASTRPDDTRIQRMGISTTSFDKVAITIDDLLLHFIEIISRRHGNVSLAKLFYYSASTDVKWLADTGVETTNVATIASKITPKRGTFETDSRTADLNSLYGMYVGPVPESGRHRAFPDAVMLGEIICAMMVES